MDRPRSIRLFELFWWGSTLFWAAATRLAWNRNQGKLIADPRTRDVAQWGQWFWIVVTLALTALLWWLVARRASAVGKWLVTAWAGLTGVLALIRVFSLFAGRTLHPLSESAYLLTAVLAAAAAATLFRDDARVWFGEFDAAEDEEVAA